MIPTILMLLCGIIKCYEQILALYYGSTISFRSSILLEAHKISTRRARLLIRKNANDLSHLQVVQYAFLCFTIFKGLVVNLFLDIRERGQSREFFLVISYKDAFRVVEVELN